jgi:hypothetical protein
MALAELNETVEARGAAFPLRGRYDERFRPVVDAFIDNFRGEEELGAGASVVLDGATVVDLWGGWARADHSQEWDEHSTVCMMSVAKGVTGICFNMAIDRGLIDPDERIATYWPEFAQNGKQDISVRMVLDHGAVNQDGDRPIGRAHATEQRAHVLPRRDVAPLVANRQAFLAHAPQVAVQLALADGLLELPGEAKRIQRSVRREPSRELRAPVRLESGVVQAEPLRVGVGHGHLALREGGAARSNERDHERRAESLHVASRVAMAANRVWMSQPSVRVRMLRYTKKRAVAT